MATMRVDVSGPGFAPRTASVPVTPSSKEVDISVNAPAGSDRTIYLAALDAANQLLFSGSVSGVTIPASGPIPVTVVLPFRVMITKQGGGSGTVTASPSGFTCGANCFDFDGGTSVTLTASADPGSVFAGWSGGGCSGTGACTVTTDATIAAHLQCCHRHRHRDGDEDGLGHRHRDQHPQRHCLWRLLFGQFRRRDLGDPDRRWQRRINIRRLERRLQRNRALRRRDEQQPDRECTVRPGGIASDAFCEQDRHGDGDEHAGRD